MTEILVAGLGSPHGDDQAGWYVADRIARDAAADIAVRRMTSPLNVLDHLDDVTRLVICDACEPAGHPGRLQCWTWPTDGIAVLKSLGSHDFGLPAVLRLAEALGRLPPTVILVGIEAETWTPHAELSAAVTAAIPDGVAVVKAACGLESHEMNERSCMPSR